MPLDGNQQISSLSYSVRGRIIMKYFGQLCMVFAALSFVVIVVSLIFGEYIFTVRYAVIFIFSALLGIALNRLQVPHAIQPNEALVITGFAFIFASLVSVYPMMGAGITFVDALFESVSGFTTTGLSTLATVEDKPMTFLFSRAWMQWIGGLGIVVLSVALLMRPGVATKRLMDIEKGEDIVGGTRLYAVKILKVYLTLTAIGIIVLLLLGENIFSSIVHTLSAVSTGGFSIYDSSLLGLKSHAAEIAVIFISLMGALSLILYYTMARTREGYKKFFGDAEVRIFLLVCMLATIFLSISMSVQAKAFSLEVIQKAPLLAFSAQTTTGFSNVNVSELDSASKLILILSMALGGTIGSSAGGIKIIRLVILVKLLHLLLNRASLPEHAVVDFRLAGQPIEKDEVERAALIVFLFVGAIVFSWLPFLIFGYEPLDSLFEVVSAVGTVGLSSGISSQDLPSFLKGVLCVDMFIGRLEIIAVLILLYPRTWFGRRKAL
jgi:trk/ktr system potassium uptake protein